ncbi:hypothetical protein BLNAU_19904 [Blattamonas nauphoetae]|uniref:Uncharacterized protein n=1 Tax=Blattamonas nauphoetae TaxID=2049346 RepID=A0ABQ9X0C9_9EUKA|nr:hypothetical protein BLNAU_19904 [Blattamonas nauphoetae]
MIGVEVVGCTNHLYGTVCNDMNDGGSVLCQNSSFSRCSTSLEPSSTHPTYTLQHHTGKQKLSFTSSSGSSAITITRCTFHTMSATSFGGALEFSDSLASVSISECSFVNSVASSSGGAVPESYGGSVDIRSPVSCTVSDCHFIGTKTTVSYGGYIFLDSPNGSVQLSNCLIEDGTAAYGGGAVYGGGFDLLNGTTRISVKDSLFDGCSASSSGGGIVIRETESFLMQRVNFRACTASSGAKDVTFWNLTMAEVEDGNMVTNCISTSGANNVYFWNGSLDGSTLIPQVASIGLLSVTLSASLDGDDVGGTLTVTTSENVEGRMLVVVDNSLSDYEKPNVDSPPPIARLFVFDFSTPSTTSSQSIKFNEWNTLQYESYYTIPSAFLHNADISVSPSVLQTPNPPRIVEVLTDWSESDPERISFQLKGRTLSSGNYNVKLKGVSDFSIAVSFTGQQTPPAESRNMHSLIVQLLVGEVSKLRFDMTYEIDDVIEMSTGKPLILDPPRLFFTTPGPPTLKSVGTISFSDSKKDSITIQLIGELLFVNPYALTLSDGTSTSTVIAEFDADGVNGEATAVVYSMDDSETVQLGFGKTYTITGFTCPGNDQPTLTPNLQIIVPSEPARVEKVVSAALNDAQNEVEVTFQGRAIPSTITSITVTGQDPLVLISIKRLSDTSFSALFNVAETVSPTSLAFGETYSIDSVSSGLNILICHGVNFRVPSNVRLIDIDTTFSNNVKTGFHLVLTVEGSIHDSKYKLVLADNREVEVECSSSTLTCRTTAPIRIGWETGFKYGTEHTLSTMEEIGGSSQRVDLVMDTFTTDSKPTQPVFHVDESGGLSDFCGDNGDKCKTIDEAWRIVKGIGFPRPTLLIMVSTTLDSPIVVTEGMHVIVTNSSVFEPKLSVTSHDLSGGELGMIVVDSAFLELKDVDVLVLSVSPSFVLIHGTNSELIFRDGSFAGPFSGMTMNEESDTVCSWSSGALQLVNCDTHISSTSLFRLTQGAINMKNGSLEIDTSSFDSNSASSSSFPSSRRNIHCSDEGSITIESLSGGDGCNGLPLWASLESCSMNGYPTQPNSPLFVPQLNKDQSKCVFDTATQQYQVTLVGSRLIPCGLFLEVFEYNSDSNTEGQSVEFELNHESSDTQVTLVIGQKEIATLDQTQELRCRLKFGQNQQTTNWFTFSAAQIKDPEPTWTLITVDSGGSDEIGECGSAEDPCGSVVVGWRAGQRKMIGDGVRISIKKEVGFGERMWVGSERLLIQSASGNRSRLICESSVFGEREGKEGRDERMGIVTIGGGLVELCDLVLSLVSTSSGEVVGAFVVFGKGRFVVSSVEIVSSLSAGGGGVVGMGVGWVSGGEMEVKSVLMRNVFLNLPLFGGDDKHDGLDVSVCELRVENTTTSDALIHFSSLSPSSSFSLSNSSFMTTIRPIGSAPSSSSPTNLSLISVWTCQELLSVVDCVFEKSGTCLSSSPSTLTGNALHITLCSPFRCSSTIVISRCLFIDCLSVLSGCRTLQISTGAHSAKIVLSNDWFENLASGSSWPSRKGGIAVVDWTRSGSVSASSSSTAPVGIFVYFGSLRPTIIRRRFLHPTQIPIYDSLSSLSSSLSKNDVGNFDNRIAGLKIIHLPNDLTVSSTIQIRSEEVSLVAHHSKTCSFPPLVDILHPLTMQSSVPNSELNDPSLDAGADVSVVGAGLVFDSTPFSAGTGPLFSFGLADGPSLADTTHSLRMETTLMESSLVNVTSRRVETRGELLFGGQVNQQVVGCSICESTNHNSGTTMMDGNLGGNLRCANTSFNDCRREENTDPSFINENITQTTIGRKVFTSSSTATLVSYSLCTFKDMTVADGRGVGGGAAVYFYKAKSSLSVLDCFFENCRCTARHDDGGAICMWGSSAAGQCLRLERSSFSRCNTSVIDQNFAGCVIVGDTPSVAIRDCFFENSSALLDGALTLYTATHSILFNCAFVLCSGKNYSGTVGIHFTATFEFNFVHFRECSSVGHPNGSDVFLRDIAASQVTSDMFKFCDSTSGSPNVFFLKGSVSNSDFIPQIPKASTPSISLLIDFDDIQELATVNVTASEAIGGTMGILLTGLIVPRVVHVTFGTSDTKNQTGIEVVSSGQNGVLPKADYSLLNFSHSSSLFPPVIFGCVCRPDDTDSILLVVDGWRFEEGKYFMNVKAGTTDEEKEVALNRLDNETLRGTAPLYPSTAEGRLEWETEYEVARVVMETMDGNRSIVPLRTLKFTTPTEPIQIEKTKCTLGGEKEKAGVVEFWGVGLSSGDEYTLKVQKEESEGMVSVEEIELKGTLSSESESGSFLHTENLFGASSPRLSYGESYLVVGIVVGGVDGVVNKKVGFSVPSEPSRLTKITASEFTDTEKTRIELTFETHALAANTEYQMMLKSIVGEVKTGHEKEIVLTTNVDGVFPVFRVILYPMEEDETKMKGQLEFGTRYEVQCIQRESTLVHIETRTTFSTPPEPVRIEKCISRSLNRDRAKMTLVLKGRLLSSPQIKICLSNGSHKWAPISPISVKNDTHCSVDFLVGKEQNASTLAFGTEYTLKQDGESTDFVVHDEIVVSIPSPPTLSEIKFSFANSLNTSCVVEVIGIDLVPSTEYNVTLNSSLWVITGEIQIGWKGGLQFEREYTVTSVKPLSEEDGDITLLGSVSGETGKRPSSFNIFTDSSSMEGNQFCGDFRRACSSISEVWKIVTGLSIARPTIEIIDSVTMSEGIRIDGGMHVVLRNGTSSEPSLIVPSLFSLHSLTAVSVVEAAGFLELRNVDVWIESTDPSFVFLSATQATIGMDVPCRGSGDCRGLSNYVSWR